MPDWDPTDCESCGVPLWLRQDDRPEDDPPAVFCHECGGGCETQPRLDDTPPDTDEPAFHRLIRRLAPLVDSGIINDEWPGMNDGSEE